MTLSNDKNKQDDIPFLIPTSDSEDSDVFTSLDHTPKEAFKTIEPHHLQPIQPTSPALSLSSVTHGKLAIISPKNEIVSEHHIIGSRYLIGRNSSDLVLKDEFVSQWHAQIYRDTSGTLILADLESHNGVYLRIPHDFQLEDNDELVVGQQRFIFRDKSPSPILPTYEHNAQVQTAGGQTPGVFPHLIHVLAGGHIGGLYPLKDNLTIGRQNSDINFPNDPWLADQHIRIERQDGAFVITDARTEYGTFVRVLKPLELFQGDCFLIGRTRITLIQKRD